MYKIALAHFKASDPILYRVSLKYKNIRLSKSDDYFVSLCREIIGQQLSTRVARVIFERFKNLFPDKKITPKHTLAIPEGTMRSVGTSWAKAIYIKDIAEKVTAKKIRLNLLHTLTDEQVIAELTQIKGVGTWTAEMFLMFSLGRPDVFSYGDLGLQNAIRTLYKLKNKPSVHKMTRLSKKWIPYRTYAALILWEVLDNKPVR